MAEGAPEDAGVRRVPITVLRGETGSFGLVLIGGLEENVRIASVLVASDDELWLSRELCAAQSDFRLAGTIPGIFCCTCFGAANSAEPWSSFLRCCRCHSCPF